jgi:hypothetical protein
MTRVQIATITLLSSALCLLACRTVDPEPSGPPAKTDTAKPQPVTGPSAPADAKPESPSDPELADKLADLDDMCKALNRDYGDGTLGDYYAGFEPRTSWGKQQITAGNESTQPGRLLERAMVELSAPVSGAGELSAPVSDAGELAPGSDALAHCRKLLEYLDEVE